MSLRVWLPLTKDLRNQGLDDIPSFQLISGNSFITGGKIGEKAFNITKQQRILSNTSCMTGKKQMSYAYWVKVNTVWTTQWLDGIAWYSTDGTSASYSRQEFYNNCTKVGTWFKGSPSSLSGYDFNPEEWTHIAATFNYNTGEAKFYLNGELKGTSNGLSTSDYCRGDFYIGDTGLDILENDFRIYDHALSPMEVKQISQGLVLHYPLNHGGLGQENLLKNTNVSVTNGSKTGFMLSQTIPSGTKVTFSLQIDAIDLVLSGSKRIGLEGFQNNGTNNSYKGVWITGTNAQGTYSKRIFATVTLDRDFLINNNTFGIYVQTVSSGSVTISNPKIEIGDKSTPWCPNETDELATTMGMNNNIEYDTSGFCNNGTRIDTFNWTSDTPKYNVSTVFNGNNNIIKASHLPEETKTISIWLKTVWDSASGYRLAVHDKKTGLAIGFSGTQLITYIGSTNGGSGSRIVISNKYIANQWNHIVVIKTGDTTRDVYINGELITPSNTNFWGGDLEELNIGGRHINGSYSGFFNGLLSDFRAYVTALSAEDVLDLYNLGAAIDTNNNLYGAMLEEG